MEQLNEMIGTCTMCGMVVKADDIGQTKPKLICKTCVENERIAKEKAILEEKELRKKTLEEVQAKYAKKKTQSLIWGIVVGVLSIIGGIYTCIAESYDITMYISSVLGGYIMFSFIVCVLQDGIVQSIFLGGIGHGIKIPGVIISFDLDGLMFLIAIKLLFAFLSLFISLLIFFCGFALSAIISMFVWPSVIFSKHEDSIKKEVNTIVDKKLHPEKYAFKGRFSNK